MLYDANGERLTRTDSSGTTVYLPGGQEIRVEDGEVVSAVRYYSFDGQSVAVRTGKGLGAVTSLVADMHGTALVAIANTTWTAAGVVKQYTDPFGAARGAGVDVPGERQFLDKTRDPSTGLTQVGARYYDETTGRFISVDPVLDLTNPQQWNAYVYANNNPTTWSDPTGLMISWDWLTDPIARAGRGTANWYSTWLEDSDGQSIIVNSLQSRGAGSADAVLGAVDLVTPGTIGRFGNPNTNSIYAYSDDIGQWVGPQILIGGNAGNAAKATTYVGNLGEKALAQAAASLSARAAVETAVEAAPSVVAAERTAAQALKPSEAVARWDDFLGKGPTTNTHPRTGLPDPNRIVSADGARSIRFGPHEMGSSPTRFHFHEETWSFDPGSNTWFVDNVLVRVPFPKGAW